MVYLYVFSLLSYLFFFKQKTAYEMRISDWSSDVCSSDLGVGFGDAVHDVVDGVVARADVAEAEQHLGFGGGEAAGVDAHRGDMAVARVDEIGRASCRERVCKYV